ncbi:MAG: hypothetical protein ABI467_16135 [Kofleriaceae bacterium]
MLRVRDRREAPSGDVAKRAFAAMMEIHKIDVATIEAAMRGETVPA